MRAALILVLALGGPVLLFFLWAWASAIKRERKLQGTLPAWQDLPWTNLLIAGLLLAIAGILVMYFTDDRKGGLFGMNGDASVILSEAKDPAVLAPKNKGADDRHRRQSLDESPQGPSLRSGRRTPRHTVMVG
jgi:hypothetical protein